MLDIPFRFKSASYSSDVPKGIKDVIESWPSGRKGLYIFGPVGTGKTHIAYAIAKEIDSRGGAVMVYSAAELLLLIREGFRDDHEEETDRDIDPSKLYKILNFKGILVIDDIGGEKMTEWVAETFDLIINKRYQNAIPTIFTSNFSLGELQRRVGDRIPSRIVEMCEIIESGERDRRLEDKK